MTMLGTRRTILAATILQLFFSWGYASISAQAHDAPYVLTSLEWNARTGSLEVIHRLHMHQALDAVAIDEYGSNFAVKNSSLAAVARYVEDRFRVVGAESASIQLTFVGAEVQGDYLFVYQEAVLDDAPYNLRVRNDILADRHADQVNQVNVTLMGKSRTLIFDKSNRGQFL